MKKLRNLPVLVMATGLCVSASDAFADLEVTTSVQIHARVEFEAPLASHGTWVEFGSYGRCWRPARVAVGWRPFCAGEWVWTDCGWYWASDEPWAWACYHYGTWTEDPTIGWVWVPGVEWAPAWVSWRVGGGYIGWAPLPPRGVVFAGTPRPEAFVFIGEGKFAGPIRPGTLVIKDAGVFKRTMAFGAVERETRSFGALGPQKVMVNKGPSLQRIQKATGRSFSAVSIREAVNRTPGPVRKSQAYASKDSGPEKAREDRSGEHSRDADSSHGRSSPDNDQAPGRDSGGFDRGDRAGRSSGGDGRRKH